MFAAKKGTRQKELSMIHRDKRSESNAGGKGRRLGFSRPFRNSAWEDSEFQFDRDPYIRTSRGDEHPNRFGEGKIYRDYYDDEYGMRHPFNEEERENLIWSRDPRSEASTENHYGKGPKGYKRDDNRILEDVCDALTHDSELDASLVEVRVDKGHVTLSGEVEDRNSKRLAEAIVDRVRGVDDVFNRLQVRKYE
jgi:hypothetical protein